jgi:3-hydroxy-5-methyl-1-naphthoate 3-O-methyltransferase
MDDLAPDPTRLLRLREGVYADDLVIAAIVELDLFTRLAGERWSAAEIAAALGLATRPTVVMCEVLESAGLLHRDGETLAPSPLALAFLVDGAPRDLRAYFASLGERPAVRELAGVLRSGAPAAWASAAEGEDWAQRLDDPAFAEQFTAAMDARGRVLGPPLAATLADLPIGSVLDVAGGSGIYGCALRDANPRLRVSVLERPPIDRVARRLLARRGHGDVEVIAGDMFDALPGGHDLHLYVHVLHDWGVPPIERLLRASYAALPPGGWVVDYDAHLNGAGRASVAAYSVLLMHATEGRCYTSAEMGELMRAAGFADVEVRPTLGDRSAILARRP